MDGGLGCANLQPATELAAAGLLATSRTEEGVRWLAPLPSEERGRGNSGNVFPEIHFMETGTLKEEEVNINTIPPPPPLPPPPGVFTGNGLPAVEALARFMVENGAFPGVARSWPGCCWRHGADEAGVQPGAAQGREDSGMALRAIDAERVTAADRADAQRRVPRVAWRGKMR